MDKEIELLETLKLARSYIYNESGEAGYTHALYLTPAESLRRQADALEAKAEDLKKIDEVIRKYESLEDNHE